MVAARLEAGIVDPIHAGMPLEVLRDGERVLGVALQAKMERLNALQQKERVERRERRAGVAQALDARLEDERERPEGLGVGKAVVRRIGLGEVFETARGCPVELAGIDDDAAYGGSVAAEKLGRRIYDDIRSPFDGPHRAAEGVVLSMTSGRPCSWAMAASFSMSATSSLGLPSDSV